MVGSKEPGDAATIQTARVFRFTFKSLEIVHVSKVLYHTGRVRCGVPEEARQWALRHLVTDRDSLTCVFVSFTLHVVFADAFVRGRPLLRVQSHGVQPPGGESAQLVAARVRRLHRPDKLR